MRYFSAASIPISLNYLLIRVRQNTQSEEELPQEALRDLEFARIRLAHRRGRNDCILAYDLAGFHDQWAFVS